MTTKQARKQFTIAHKHLREARRAFVLDHRGAILLSEGCDYMDELAKQMIEEGLYADPGKYPPLKDYRFSILRILWSVEKEMFGENTVGGWHFWIPRNQFNWRFYRNAKIALTA